MATRSYSVQANLPRLQNDLDALLRNAGYKLEVTRETSSGFVIEGTISNTVRDWTGLSSALTVRVTSEPSGTRV